MQISKEVGENLDKIALDFAYSGAWDHLRLDEIKTFNDKYGLNLSEEDIRRLKLEVILNSLNIAIKNSKDISLFRKCDLFEIINCYEHRLVSGNLIQPGYENITAAQLGEALDNSQKLIRDGFYNYLHLLYKANKCDVKAAEFLARDDGNKHNKYVEKAANFRAKAEKYFHTGLLM